MRAWISPVEELFVATPPDGGPIVDCLVTVDISPEGPLGEIEAVEPLEVIATVHSPDGSTVTDVGDLGFAWHSVLGLNTSDEGKLMVDRSIPGLREAEVTFKYFSVPQTASIAGVVVPEHRGSRTMSVSGQAAYCLDPDDNGSGKYDVTIFVDTEVVTPLTATGAGVTLIATASYANVVMDSMQITATYNDNTAQTTAGIAGGKATFTVTEIDPDSGQPVQYTGSVDMSGEVMGRAFSFLDSTGSDVSGCQLDGDILILN